VIPKYGGGGGKRTGGTKGEKEARRQSSVRRSKRIGMEKGCLMPRIITAFNLERSRVTLGNIRTTLKAAIHCRR